MSLTSVPRRKKIIEYLIFLFGFLVSLLTILSYSQFFLNFGLNFESARAIEPSDHTLYNDSLAKLLFDEVKVLCWVFTHPENYKTRLVSVRNTWGNRCNKILFMSNETSTEADVIALPVEPGRDHLWNKTKNAIHYVSSTNEMLIRFLTVNVTGVQASS